MKVVIAAVMYSPNLGDGLIADCLTDLIHAERPEAEVVWLDLAGRTGFSAPSGGLRTLVLGALARSPSWISQPVSAALVGRQIKSRLAPLVPAALDGADLMIIGGGQLFGDANLNFPLKLSHVVAAAEAHNIPVAIHGVGVAGTWSARGQALFARVLTSPALRFISVRDEASAQNLAAHYKKIGVTPPCEILVFPDPGLCADGHGASEPGQTPPQRVGLGIVHPAALATHASNGSAPSLSEAVKDYVAVAKALRDRNVDVHLFTNGAGEDEEMLDQVWSQASEVSGVHRTPRCASPTELVAFLKGMDAIASHRLHACIATNALGKKAVGFEWDKKINAFFKLTEQPDQLFPGLSPAQPVVDALMEPLSNQTVAALAELKPRISDGVAAVLKTID